MPHSNHDLLVRIWRTGRKVRRTIYAMIGERPSDSDILIGVMDTPAMANDAVVCHNLRLEFNNVTGKKI